MASTGWARGRSSACPPAIRSGGHKRTSNTQALRCGAAKAHMGAGQAHINRGYHVARRWMECCGRAAPHGEKMGRNGPEDAIARS